MLKELMQKANPILVNANTVSIFITGEFFKFWEYQQDFVQL